MIKSFPEYISKHPEYTRVEDVEKFVHMELLNAFDRTDYKIAVDTETTYNPDNTKAVIRFINGNPTNEPFCVTITTPTNSYYIDHDLDKLKPLLESPHIQKIFHNSKYDIHMFKNIDVEVKGFIWDTMIMIHLIDEEFECNMPSGKKQQSKKLKNLAYHFLGSDAHELEDLVKEYRRIIALNTGRHRDEVTYKEVEEVNPDLMKDYACADTDFTYQLFDIFYPRLVQQELLLAYETDMYATLEVLEIERNGIKIDLDFYKHLDHRLGQLQRALLNKIYKLVGVTFNVFSSEELVNAYTHCGIVWDWFTESGAHKIDEKTLNYLTKINGDPGELSGLILKYRDVCKIKDTFIKNMLDYVQPDGRVHPNFNVCPNDFSKGGTVTGRLSSSDPNFQNIPKGNDIIRRGIIPDENFILVEFDFDQQEYRLMAHYANDPAFKKFIDEGKDIHSATASLMFDTPYIKIIEEVAKKDKGEDYDKHIANLRKISKSINFGLLYGIGLASFAQSIGLTIDIDKYNKASYLIRMKGIKPWELPSDEELVAMFHNDDRRAIEYYISDEARKTINEAKELKTKYFEQFPDIERFIKDCTNVTKNRGWVKTWTGRRRHFKDARNEAYKAPNALIQGGCGDILKVKLKDIGNYLRSVNAKSKLINTVHDSINLEVHKDEMFVIDEVRRILEDLPFRVPITCGCEISETNWADLKKI